MAENLRHAIDLICYDFDGVMTDNRVIVSEDGTESVVVNRSDGWAIAAMRKMGIPQVIMSTETNPVVAARAAKLKIPVLQGLDDKQKTLRRHVADNGWSLKRVVFVGNDVNDLEAMDLVGIPVAPRDSHPRVLAIATHVTDAIGGAGVIREFYETFILDQGR